MPRQWLRHIAGAFHEDLSSIDKPLDTATLGGGAATAGTGLESGGGGGVDGGFASVDDGGAASYAVAAVKDKVAEQHSVVHAFHHHIPRAPRHGSSATGIIWLLIVLHVAFIAYWAWIWWRSRLQREEKKLKSSVPQKVNCVYDWGGIPLPQIPNIQLASKSAQH